MIISSAKLPVTLVLLIAISCPSASAAPILLGPQLTELSLNIQDEIDETNSYTKVLTSFTLKNTSGNLVDLQIFLSGKEPPADDSKCTMPSVLVPGGQPNGTVGRTDLSRPISTIIDGPYTIRKYEFTTTYLNANFCSGDWNVYGYHIMDTKGEYFYRYTPPSGEQFGLFPYIYSWNKQNPISECPLVGGKNPTANIGGTLYAKFEPCYAVVDLSKPVGTYDKAGSLARAKQIFADRPTDAQLEAESAAAEKEASKLDNSLKQKITISCIKGKSIKKVTSIKPKCPAGYKVRR